MKVLFIAPQADAMILELTNLDLHNLQALVGGLIEVFHIAKSDNGNSLFAVVNEEGLRMGMPPNRFIRHGERTMSLVGNIFIVSSDSEGEFAELTLDECRRLHELVGKHWKKYPVTAYKIPTPTISFS